MITLSAASAHALPLQDGTVHSVVTSPPYYSLRRYEGQQEIAWPVVSYRPMPGQQRVTMPPIHSALGLEPTPEAYIAHLVLCFREIRRVLRDDGCCWAVMGDSYAAQPGQRKETDKAGLKQNTNVGAVACPSRHSSDLQGGDLMLIPHRLALALQGDGWTCRNDVVWAKKSPMPESVAGWRWERCKVKVGHHDKEKCPKDVGYAGAGGKPTTLGYPGWREDVAQHGHRLGTIWQPCPGCPKCSPSGYVLRRGSWRHTRAHETVLMLTKGMGYFCDQEKVREAHARLWNPETLGGSLGGTNWHKEARGNPGRTKAPPPNPAGRNPRSVLTPRPESYPGAHYAVFPTTLIAPLIRASCPAKCCPECGAAWAAVVERKGNTTGRRIEFGTARLADEQGISNDSRAWPGGDLPVSTSTILGYRRTCSHDGDPVPGTVLDPFVGSGTVLAVARELGLNAIGLDLSPSYLDEHAKVRVGRTPSRALETLPLFKEEF